MRPHLVIRELRVVVLVLLRVDFLEALGAELESPGHLILLQLVAEVGLDDGVDAEEGRCIARYPLPPKIGEDGEDDVQLLGLEPEYHSLVFGVDDLHHGLLSPWRMNCPCQPRLSHSVWHFLEQM